ncbi:acetate/propionate family kinase [Streptomyces sp. MS2.AVA.5]|uniref:Acetate/propionate family kinase n=1 Tax=Streptomyces achmelvichensis TaxID=3134111 RepID=A0ACC6Q7I0_9ACTN
MSPARVNDPSRRSVLVLDAGSSSLHITLFSADGARIAARHSAQPPGPESAADLRDFLTTVPRPTAVGHRLVHGGPRLTHHMVIDGRVRKLLDEVRNLAPLHLPPALAVVDTAGELLPDVPHVGCFDTVFHRDLPAAAREYAVPEQWRTEHGMRRYGFHGLSYAWCLERTAEVLERPADDLQAVLVHLGGGCSACAVRDGRSVDTTMGLTPLEGLVMSRRSGSIDPGALLWLQRCHGLTTHELEEDLHRRSGLLGLSGTSGDTRDLVRARDRGDTAAETALAVFVHSCRRGIAAMSASLDRLDALVFTGEIGEDQPEVREEVCAGLGILGVRNGLAVPPLEELYQEGVRRIDGPGSRVPVAVVATGETQQIAVETRRVLMASDASSGGAARLGSL